MRQFSLSILLCVCCAFGRSYTIPTSLWQSKEIKYWWKWTFFFWYWVGLCVHVYVCQFILNANNRGRKKSEIAFEGNSMKRVTSCKMPIDYYGTFVTMCVNLTHVVVVITVFVANRARADWADFACSIVFICQHMCAITFGGMISR